MDTPIATGEPLALDEGLFGRLRRDCARDWDDYVNHPFLAALADGSLPIEAFREFLVQDYLYLIHYARAYALAAFKSDTLESLRTYSRAMAAIVDGEMPVHIAYCADWGLTEKDLVATPERLETIAYTRFLIDRGMAGDLLDLQAALAPCIAGYAEIGDIIRRSARTVLQGNPYALWIENYGGAEYRAVANAAIRQLNSSAAAGGGEARYDSLIKTFRGAVQLETAFWGMGWAKR